LLVYHSVHIPVLHSFPTRRSSDLGSLIRRLSTAYGDVTRHRIVPMCLNTRTGTGSLNGRLSLSITLEGEITALSIVAKTHPYVVDRKSTRLNSKSRFDLVCRLLLE